MTDLMDRVLPILPFLPHLLAVAGIAALVLFLRYRPRPVPSPEARARRAVQLQRRGEPMAAGKVYEEMGRFREAGEQYQRGGDVVLAALMYRKADQPLKAAPLLLVHGYTHEAAECFSRSGKHKEASQAYAASGHPGLAATEAVKGGDHALAAPLFAEAGDLRKAAESWGKAGNGAQVLAVLERAIREGQRWMVGEERLMQVLERGAPELALAAWTREGEWGRVTRISGRLGRWQEVPVLIRKGGKAARLAVEKAVAAGEGDVEKWVAALEEAGEGEAASDLRRIHRRHFPTGPSLGENLGKALHDSPSWSSAPAERGEEKLIYFNPSQPPRSPSHPPATGGLRVSPVLLPLPVPSFPPGRESPPREDAFQAADPSRLPLPRGQTLSSSVLSTSSDLLAHFGVLPSSADSGADPSPHSLRLSSARPQDSLPPSPAPGIPLETATAIAMLQGIDAFSSLPTTALVPLAEVLEMRMIHQGERVFTGDPLSDGAVALLGGGLEVMEDGIWAPHPKGRLLGAEILLGPTPPPQGRAAQRSLVVVLTAAGLSRLDDSYPQSHDRVVEVLRRSSALPLTSSPPV